MAKNKKASFLKSPEFIGGAIGGLGGLAKSMVDQPAYEQAVASRAIEARFAPLRGERSPSFSDLQSPDTFQNSLDFGLAGVAQGRKFRESQEERKAKQDKEAKKILDSVSPAQRGALEAGYGPLSNAAATSDSTFEEYARANAPKQQPAVFGSDYRGADPRFEDTMAAFNKAPIIAKDNNLSNEEFAKFLQGNTGGFSGRRF